MQLVDSMLTIPTLKVNRLASVHQKGRGTYGCTRCLTIRFRLEPKCSLQGFIAMAEIITDPLTPSPLAGYGICPPAVAAPGKLLMICDEDPEEQSV